MTRRIQNADRIAAALDANPQAAEYLDYYIKNMFGRRYIAEQMALRHNIDYPDSAWYIYIRARYPRGGAGGKSTLCYLVDKYNIYRKVVVDMARRNESYNAIRRALIDIGFRCGREAIAEAMQALGIDYKPPPRQNGKATVAEVLAAMASAAPGTTIQQIAEGLGIHKGTLYNRLRKLKGAKE